MRILSTCTVLALATPTVVLSPALRAADHREAPLIQTDVSADIADVYIFRSPTNSNNTVLVMTVNPFTAPSENTTYNFSPNVRYSFRVDRDGDALSDLDIRILMSEIEDGAQRFRIKCDEFQGFGDVTMPTLEPVPNDPIINIVPGGTKVFAGQTDDPFFFDVVGFNRVLNGTGSFSGTDGFAGYNTSAIAVELPTNYLTNGAGLVQIWGTTERREVTLRRSDEGKLEKAVGDFQQVDRMGNPAIGTALIPDGQKDFYNIGQPQNDPTDYAAVIVEALRALGTSDENISILASIAVPDTIKFNPLAPSEYPNGRRPKDDVIDTLFFFMFNQSGVRDGVDTNDKGFLDSFPYLSPPHQPS